LTLVRRILTRFLPNGHYHGWTVVGVAMCCSALSSPGQSFALSLYIEHLITDLGISRVGISSIYAAATLSAAATLPLVGAFADRSTARRFMFSVLLGIGLALVLLSQARGVIGVAAALFALRLLGQGAVGLGTLTATVRWFRRYRGRALAIVGLGYALGELVFPGLIVLLTGWFGWRGSLLALAAFYVAVAAPLAHRHLRERTSDDPPMDGSNGDEVHGSGRRSALPELDFSLGASLRSPTFWAMLVVVSISPMLLTALIFHQVALFDVRGWGAALIPVSFATYAIAGVVVPYGVAILLERIPVRLGVTASLLLIAGAMAWYAWGVGGVLGAVVYGGLLGTTAAVAATTNALIWPEYFGVRALGTLKGVVNAVRNGATALGPVLLAALAVDQEISTGLLVLASVGLAGAGAALFIAPPAAGLVEPGR